jgi:hypothetical protein
MSKTIKSGDFILITDIYDGNYLKIGEVIDIDIDFDGDPKSYSVRFGYGSETSVDTVVKYRYELLEGCRVLMFENR